ncbi:ABC transporter substrate-binding protein [Amycolatopsis sp. NPDC051903]|uniref:ABC transporter substrate-binding protein n=1 Tax=Amycolatopsis sp. NPDC051903 TaxID=3363936 RepID=UPI00379CDA2C
MTTFSRFRHAIALAGAAAVLTACGGGSSAAGGDGKTIRVELFCSGLAPIAAELALNSGVAAKRGITIKPICVTSGSAATNALIGGSADVFMGDIGHVVLAQKRGVKMKAYGVVNDRFSYLMVARTDPDLATVKDLKGKKVAVTAPGTLSDTELQKAALDAGLDPKKDLTVVSGGAGATMQAELTSGQVVAGMTSQPDTLQLLRTGKFRVLWQQPDYRYVDIVTMADQDWVGEHQDLLKTFLAAMSEASRQAKANPDQATTWMKKQGYQIGDADLKTIVTEALKSVPDSFHADDAVVNSSTDLLVRTGFLTKPVPSTQDIFDDSLLPAK